MQILDFCKIENLYILLWLLKDLCWVVDWKLMGSIMIVLMVGVVIWLIWKMRKNYVELMYNFVVVCWICVNVIWMLGEFYFYDGICLYVIGVFVVGLGLLVFFYFGKILGEQGKLMIEDI